MTATTENVSIDPNRSPFSASARVWVLVGFVSWSVALALTLKPPVTESTTLAWMAVALVVLVAMLVSLAEPLHAWPASAVLAATGLALAGWCALMVYDDRWSVLTFALYSMCFARGRALGMVLAAFVSGVWILVWIGDDEPSWRLMIPFAAFAVGAIMAVTVHRVGEENETQAKLIAELRATQDELAASERERGTLEERSRFAGEIHDTLAQGFTSIVLLSRTTQMTKDWSTGLASIESVAEENLNAARRLVAALKPVELEGASLAEALERALSTLGDGVESTFTREGTPVSLDSAVEVTLLRAAQEALLNIRNHAQASTVHMTLSYVGASVLLDVVDDGVGFTLGTVTNRGALTGGQGLDALRQRVETLGGHLEIETDAGSGTALSVMLPASRV